VSDVALVIDPVGFGGAADVMARAALGMEAKVRALALSEAKRVAEELAAVTPRGDDRQDANGDTMAHAADSWTAQPSEDGATVGNDAPSVPFLLANTAPHEIRPRFGSVLSWVAAGQPMFARVVEHPGTTANARMVDLLDRQPELIVAAFHGLLALEAEKLAVSIDKAGLAGGGGGMP